MALTTLLAVVGTICGIAYSALGIMALKHLSNASEADRVAGWTLWWFAESSRYSPAGRRLCKIGGVVFAFGVACWIGWYAARN